MNHNHTWMSLDNLGLGLSKNFRSWPIHQTGGLAWNLSSRDLKEERMWMRKWVAITHRRKVKTGIGKSKRSRCTKGLLEVLGHREGELVRPGVDGIDNGDFDFERVWMQRWRSPWNIRPQALLSKTRRRHSWGVIIFMRTDPKPQKLDFGWIVSLQTTALPT